MVDDRWVEVTPSQFPHEAEGLRIIRDLLPQRAPFRAWTNFEFRDERGTWSEVDLLILAPDGLHLIELKYYSGRLRGNDQTWLRSGHAPEDSPLRLANRKAKRLRSKLMRTYDDWKSGRKFSSPPPPARQVIPFIQEAVFLHHPNLVVELPEQDRRDLYGLPDSEARSGLASITDLFTGTPRHGTPPNDAVTAQIIALTGLRPHHREAGSFILDDHPLEDGPGWQDWLGTHKLLQSRRRIRFRTVPEGSSDEAHRRVRRIAEHEVRVMQHLSHDSVLRPEDLVDSDLGPGLVYPYDRAWQRLDLWLAGLSKPLNFDDQLALIRLIAEALQYAHGRHVVHRGLNPRAVLVRRGGDGRLRVKVGDWQGVGRIDEATSVEATRGVTQLAEVLSDEVPKAERWARGAFTAPEGVWVGTPDRLRLDVFSLGALAFYLVTDGRLPAPTRADLTARLRKQDGLDVSVEPPRLRPRCVTPSCAPRDRRSRNGSPMSARFCPPWTLPRLPPRKRSPTPSMPALVPSSRGASSCSAASAQAQRPSASWSPTWPPTTARSVFLRLPETTPPPVVSTTKPMPCASSTALGSCVSSRVPSTSADAAPSSWPAPAPKP